MTSFITFQALWIKTNASRQLTLSCGSDHEPQRGLPGYPGKRGRKGAIGNIGPKGDASICIIMKTLKLTIYNNKNNNNIIININIINNNNTKTLKLNFMFVH